MTAALWHRRIVMQVGILVTLSVLAACTRQAPARSPAVTIPARGVDTERLAAMLRAHCTRHDSRFENMRITAEQDCLVVRGVDKAGAAYVQALTRRWLEAAASDPYVEAIAAPEGSAIRVASALREHIQSDEALSHITVSVDARTSQLLVSGANRVEFQALRELAEALCTQEPE